MMRSEFVDIYDTTLRDGTQRYGMSVSCDDKLRIAKRLDALGVAMIEGGWPGSNPKDAEFFARARDMKWKTSQIAAFGSTCRVGAAVEDDGNLKALLEAETPICTLVGKTWLLHVVDVLRTTPEENFRIIEESLAYLKAKGRRVVFDAEHFFDGYRADHIFAVETLCAAVRGGAETLVLCDTNGGMNPWDIEQVVSEVRNALREREIHTPLGIHAHNDSGCAIANSVQAVREGASHVQGTINGYGERCGNANLCAVIPTLELKMQRRCLPEGRLKDLSDVAHFVSEVANQTMDDYMPYVGRSAFAHKGGIHVSGMRRNIHSYQHTTPELVGNQQRVVVSELSGRSNLMSKIEEFELNVDGAAVAEVLEGIKNNESRGFSYEAAEGSIVLMLARKSSDYLPLYRLIDYTVSVEHRDGRGTFAEATVKIEINGELFHTAAEGDGPVNALDRALRKALLPVYPEVGEFHLCDYKVRILDGRNGTQAVTRVLIDTTDGHQKWSTVGASNNIVEASWAAMEDSIEYGLRLKYRKAETAEAQEGVPEVKAVASA